MRLPRDLEAKCLALAGGPRGKAKPRKRREVVLPGGGSWSLVLRPPCRVVTEANTHEHWTRRAKRGKQQTQAVRDVWFASPAMSEHWDYYPRIVVTLIHTGPRMDDDNLRTAFKAIRDALADALRRDDGDASLTWQYEQRTGSPGVEIQIRGEA